MPLPSNTFSLQSVPEAASRSNQTGRRGMVVIFFGTIIGYIFAGPALMSPTFPSP